MNWLIYIGGYWITLGLLINIVGNNLDASVLVNGKNQGINVYAIAWLMCWIWICWRFIK